MDLMVLTTKLTTHMVLVDGCKKKKKKKDDKTEINDKGIHERHMHSVVHLS